MKNFFKSNKIIPAPVRKIQRIYRDALINKNFSGLTNRQTFEKIYNEKRWGISEENSRRYSSGAGTRTNEIVERYINAVIEHFSSKSHALNAIDVGCGDFYVGSHLAKYFKSYTGIDVASNVIQENREIYENIKFLCLDACEDTVPDAEVIFLRQVLQHLSNAQIHKFFKNIEGKYKYCVITESLSNSFFFSPNKDIATGPGIRIHKKSGVVLEEPPFNLKFLTVNTILEYSEGRELFQTKIYQVK
ncbi:class I SAM-dependent methyltransferase [Alphaproteobacteria bacterium]|nr:class I SAM-dependent methyltransferase [Alphaproteobacteria bacterium]